MGCLGEFNEGSVRLSGAVGLYCQGFGLRGSVSTKKPSRGDQDLRFLAQGSSLVGLSETRMFLRRRGECLP